MPQGGGDTPVPIRVQPSCPWFSIHMQGVVPVSVPPWGCWCSGGQQWPPCVRDRVPRVPLGAQSHIHGGAVQGTPGCTWVDSQVPTAHRRWLWPWYPRGDSAQRGAWGPRSDTVSPGQGVRVPEDGNGRFGVAPASPRGSLWLTAEFEETLKYDNHHLSCVLLNSAFLMPGANLWAPRGDNSQCHPVPRALVGRSHCPQHGDTAAPPHVPPPQHKQLPHSGQSPQGSSTTAAAYSRPREEVLAVGSSPGAASASPRHCPEGRHPECGGSAAPTHGAPHWAPALPLSRAGPQQTPRHNSHSTAAGDSASVQ